MPKQITFIPSVIFFSDYCAGDEYLSHYKFCTNSLKALLILESVRPGEMDGLCPSQVADSHLTFLFSNLDPSLPFQTPALKTHSETGGYNTKHTPKYGHKLPNKFCIVSLSKYMKVQFEKISSITPFISF